MPLTKPTKANNIRYSITVEQSTEHIVLRTLYGSTETLDVLSDLADDDAAAIALGKAVNTRRLAAVKALDVA